MAEPYIFGAGSGFVVPALCDRIDEIAARHGAAFLNPRMPDGHRYWFTAPRKGEPFDGDMARAVRDDLRAAGITLPGRGT